MDSSLQHHHEQEQQMNSGLVSFRSAPSSLLADFIDGGGEEEIALARFMTFKNGDSASPDMHVFDEKQMISERSTQFIEAMEEGTEMVPQQSRFSSKLPQMIYQMEQLQNGSLATGAAIGSSSMVVNSIAMGSPQVKTSSNSSNLVRHSSSPAGFSSHPTVENGKAVMRDMGNFRARNANFRAGTGSNRETASSSRLRNQTNFISSKVSFPAVVSQVSDMGTENVEVCIPESGSLGNGNDGGMCYVPGYPMSSWDDSPLGNNLIGSKRLRGDGKTSSGLNPSDMLNGEPEKHASGLSHQFSFPMTSAEMDSMEEFLEFQGSVPCNIRAKRGFATHPRSIAERVRRSRISERLRKLEELVPNMDKQTNKADMLDLAVEYVKDLQKQVKSLMDSRSSCTCSSKPKQEPTPAV